MITLRLLAGASYLDMIWYGVAVDSVHQIFKQMLSYINSVEDNIKPPKIFEDCENLRQTWKSKAIAKTGIDTLPGTILAGDGLVIAIDGPSAKLKHNLTAFKDYSYSTYSTLYTN